jgi:tRNA threonylcarbamoyladenosine biosynthesis protein TsaB
LQPQDVRIVAVNVGPGSFTGLRIAVTFAKTFAYATGADIVCVSTMDVLAEQAAEAARRAERLPRRLWTLVDAHRDQLFAATYEVRVGAGVHAMDYPVIMGIASWLDRLEADDLVTGPIVDRLVKQFPPGVAPVEPAARVPHARTVAELAWQRWQLGQRDDLWQLQPSYLRTSAAEERLPNLP